LLCLWLLLHLRRCRRLGYYGWSAWRSDKAGLRLHRWPRGHGDAARDHRADGQARPRAGHEFAARDHRPQLFGRLTGTWIDVVRHTRHHPLGRTNSSAASAACQSIDIRAIGRIDPDAPTCRRSARWELAGEAVGGEPAHVAEAADEAGFGEAQSVEMKVGHREVARGLRMALH